jgi:hypothetical protein
MDTEDTDDRPVTIADRLGPEVVASLMAKATASADAADAQR